jgi:hypothetical protein
MRPLPIEEVKGMFDLVLVQEYCLTISSVTERVLAVGAKLTTRYAYSGRGRSRKTKYIRKGTYQLLLAGHQTNPRRYVEMLEQQQTQLVAGLRDLYSRLQRGESWPGQPLREASSGHPLTHDILERLHLLNSPSENGSNYEGFDDDCNRMQRKLLEKGAPYTRRRASISSDSEHDHASSNSSYNGTPTTMSFAIDSPFARHNAPPTPPMNSPFPRQSQMVSPIKQETPMASSTFMNPGAMDPSAISRSTWLNDSMMMDEPVDFSKPMYGFDNFGAYDQNMMVDTIAINPNDPMMPDWSTGELDFSNFIQNPVGA